MSPISPIPAIACLTLAVMTASLLARRFGLPPVQGRYASIDGLRGYLAFFVFLHHAAIWFFYVRTGEWRVPPSHLYTHFGQSGVILFFMITGFLFFSKLIDGKTREIAWGRLYVSRIMRLTPLYLFAMILLFLVVFILSDGALREPLPNLLIGMARWGSFSILGAPNLNGIENTATIIAGVTWSLPYEWFFYLSLPLLALLTRSVPPLPYLVLSLVALVGAVLWGPGIAPLASFLGGIAAAILVRSDKFRSFAAGTLSSCIALGSIAAAVIFFPSGFGFFPLLLLSAGFILIACGNTLFGLLVSSASRMLGEMAYSIYLLHGISLFVLFNFVVGIPRASELSPPTHWLLIAGLTPVLVVGCFATFRFIEQPAMHSTSAVMLWLRSRLGMRKRPAEDAPLN